MNMQLVAAAAEIVASRRLNTAYIYMDIAFLVFLCVLLIASKKLVCLCWGLSGGLLYFIVDYGIFYGALHTRVVTGAPTGWFLLWLSMSYGITNFVWIWLWLSKDKRLFEWSLLILCWWIACPLISQLPLFSSAPQITISRGTGSYHGVMAILLFVGYAILCVYNLFQPKEKRVNLLWLLAIGILVQFGWEFSLLVTGIRSAGFDWGQKLMTLIVNSLVETNMGLPYIYLIHKAVTSRYTETFQKIKRVEFVSAEGEGE